MGENETPHFHDFGPFECVPKPQNHVFLSLETPESSTQFQKTSQNPFKQSGEHLKPHELLKER